MDMQVTKHTHARDGIVASRPGRKSAFSKALFFPAKLIVSAACFWYVLRQINVTERSALCRPSMSAGRHFLSRLPWRKSPSSRCACGRLCRSLRQSRCD